ncbi:MAG: Tn7-like element transposition protein TnsE, partial [Oleiphilaceae bacterium]
YALLEVDTSDNKNRLSTLLLKQPTPYFDWQGEIATIEQRLLEKSLNWPSPHLNSVFSGHHERISHPRTPSGNKGLLETGSLQRWADRVLAKMV